MEDILKFRCIKNLKKVVPLTLICLFIVVSSFPSLSCRNLNSTSTIYVNDNMEGPWDRTEEHPFCFCT
jgi:hypothetical protein